MQAVNGHLVIYGGKKEKKVFGDVAFVKLGGTDDKFPIDNKYDHLSFLYIYIVQVNISI